MFYNLTVFLFSAVSHLQKRRRNFLGALVLFLFLGQGCGQDDSGSEKIVWHSCGENLECATLAVPVDYSEPATGSIELALTKVPASDPSRKIGSLIVNPGGPGASGVDYLAQGGVGTFSPSLRQRFDIVGFDPRGIGKSNPVNCMEDLEDYFATDLTPDDESEYQMMVENAYRMAEVCYEENGEFLRHISTENVVRDLESIRVALGGDLLNYVGISYGTEIGAEYADQYPEMVRAMVLDSVSSSYSGMVEDIMTQSAGFESSMDSFFSWCAESQECAFGDGEPETAYLDLMADIDQESLTAEGRTLGPGEASYGVTMGLYSQDYWPHLAEALSAAQQGDPMPLLVFSDFYLERWEDGSYGNGHEAHLGVMCIDGPWPSLDEFLQLEKEANDRFAYLGAANLNSYLPCSIWPFIPKTKRIMPHAPGAPPILLIGITNDPATPYRWATDLADQMESAHLLTLDGEGHGALGRENPCIDSTVDDYLVSLTAPEVDKRCGETPQISAQSTKIHPFPTRPHFPWR